MYAVSAAGVLPGVLADGDGLGEGAPDGDAGADGVAEPESEGEGEADGDVLEGEDPASLDSWPVTVCPGAIVAEPVVTTVRDPTGGGARAGAGAWCPFVGPAPGPACVAEAGT
jgi:hypothetical protein